MKISKKLPQFEQAKTLIVVMGKQKGKFYLAHNGVIKELRGFSFQKPKYSDREGHFVKRGKSGIYKTGAVYEPKKERIRIELVHRLENNLKKVLARNKIDDIYLACPDYLKNRIRKTFPAAARNKIKVFLAGDYYHLHPFDLLKKIKDKIESKKRPVTLNKKDNVKILRRSKKARRVIKGKP